MTQVQAVELFAIAKELVGENHVNIKITHGTTIGDLRDCLTQQVPSLGPLMPSCRLAVDDQYASDEDEFRIGQKICLIPPVSGG